MNASEESKVVSRERNAIQHKSARINASEESKVDSREQNAIQHKSVASTSISISITLNSKKLFSVLSIEFMS